jgi:hypothetical protein
MRPFDLLPFRTAFQGCLAVHRYAYVGRGNPRRYGMKHAITLLLALAVAGAQAAPLLKYRVTALVPDYDSDLCGCEISVSDINNHGVMAGTYSIFGGYSGTFTLDKSGMYFIEGTGHGYDRYPVAINDRGQVLVNGDVSRNDYVHSYLYRGDRQPAIDISVTEFDYSRGTDLNAKGHVIGTSGDVNQRAFYYDGTQSRYLELGLPAGSRVLGLSFNEAETMVGYSRGVGAFKFENGHLSLLAGLEDTYAINDAGQILGATATGQSALRNTDGSLRLLDFNTSGRLNELGWTVGSAAVGDARHGFLYRGGRSYDLNGLLAAEDAGRWVLTSAAGVNDKGQIIGTGLFDGKAMPFLAAPVPEPGTCALMLCGLGTVGWWARQRRTPAGTPAA